MASGGKTSLYLDPAALQILGARESKAPRRDGRRYGNRSDWMREVLARYDEICRDDFPSVSPGLWDLLVATGERWHDLPLRAPHRIGAIFAALAAPQRGVLLDEFRQLTPGQRVAVLDAVERHWAAQAARPRRRPRSSPSPETLG